MKHNYQILRISYNSTKPYIMGIHYAKRMPSISYAFGLFKNEILVGVVTYGSPPSQSLCKGIAGDKHKKKVIELNRLVLKNNLKNEASILVGNSLKLLPKPSIVVSYADTSQLHTGFIYQATNFLYTGISKKRTEWRMVNSNKHSKTICEKYSLEYRKQNPEMFYVTDRPLKHRYLFICGTKTQLKEIKKDLIYSILPYPKKNVNVKKSTIQIRKNNNLLI